MFTLTEARSSKLIPWAIFLVALAYYCTLSVRSYTWLFVSQDSGDWLTASSIWLVPQPMGSPLYVFLGHLLNLLPWSLETTMPLLLSALPSAVTVTLVYLIAVKLTNSKLAGLASSLILLAAAVFLSQSTVLEEYALATMFLVLAYYFYLKGSRKATLLILGLCTAIHVMGLVFFAIWAYIERSQWRTWWKHLWIYALAGLLPYSYVIVLMVLHTPPFMAGYWSFDALFAYIFRTANGVLFNISVFDFPNRIMMALGYTVVSLGIAAIPCALALMHRKSYDRAKWILVSSALFPMIYYLLCIDSSTWTFLTFGLPFFAVLAGTYLTKLYNAQQRVIIAGAILLLLLNTIFLNTGVLASSSPLASSIKNELSALPANSVVVTYPGTYSMCMYYVWATSRHDLVPIVWQESGNGSEVMCYEDLKPQYKSYDSWLNEKYGIKSLLPIDQIAECLESGRHVYIAGPEWLLSNGAGDTSWTMLVKYYLTMEGSGRIREVTGVRHNSS